MQLPILPQKYRPRGLSAIDAVRWYPPAPDGDCLLWIKSRDHRGYGRIRFGNTMVAVHRIIFEDAHGDLPNGYEIDHTCRNRACLNIDHLRAVTHKQNQENHGGAKSTSQSGVRGVCWSKKNRKWKAQVSHFGQVLHVGLFDAIEDAERAVIAKRLELHTHNDFDRSAS